MSQERICRTRCHLANQDPIYLLQLSIRQTHRHNSTLDPHGSSWIPGLDFVIAHLVAMYSLFVADRAHFSVSKATCNVSLANHFSCKGSIGLSLRFFGISRSSSAMAQTNMGPQALDAELCCKVSVKIGINEHTLPQHSTSSSAHFTLRKVQHSWLRIGLKSMLAGQLHVSGASCKCD